MKDTDGETSGRVSRRASKSSRAFRTISEVSKLLDVPQHVLRFWESKFTQIKPMKRGGGRRYYRPEDAILLTRIRDLLYNEGYTIRGVQKLLREKGIKSILADGAEIDAGNMDIQDQPAILDAIADSGGNPGSDTVELNQVDRMELVSIRDELLSIRNALAGLS